MIGVCLKWVDRRPDIDRLTGAVSTDPRRSGSSDADQAALEWALRIGEAWNQPVIVASAGPALCEPLLRDALAAGARAAVRADLPLGASSERVAVALAAVLAPEVDLVICGGWSADRGSGSVPAYLAAHRRSAQALGLINLQVDGTPGVLAGQRRLDGGRRELIRIKAPAVVSVEGGMRLRRSPLDSVLAARDAVLEVAHPPPAESAGASRLVRTGPFRPRPRVLAGPVPTLSARERILALAGTLVDRDPPRVVRLDPAAAAAELLGQLEAWGYR